MANKKINQLVAKTTILSTDLFPLGDATTGQLFKKTVAELQAAIGGAVISVNGLVGTVVLDTDDIQELATPTNKYFTDARARGAISLTVTGNSGASTYSNSTGVLNVPTYTLAGLGGITASFLSGGTGITYNSTTGVIAYSGTVYTDASIRALFSAGTGISYNSSTGAISYSGTVYTDASIRALISLTTTGNSGVSSYNNTTGVLNVPNYTLAGLGGISLTSLSGTAPITYNSSTGAIGITQANTSTNGFLSSTDWNTFNGKQSALTLGNFTEVNSNVFMFPDGGTNKVIGNLSIQMIQSGASTNGYLSSTDWTTFNNKQSTVTLTTTGTTGASTFSAGTLNIPQYQGAITLTTTGTSGAATFSSNTLNIPQYQAVITNPVTGTGTTNYVTKWTSSSAIGNSLIFDNGTNVGVGTTSPLARLDVSSGALTGALIVGGDFNTSTGARTNATRKYAILGVPHYTNAEEPMTFAVLNSGLGVNEILIGGGGGNLNAATSIEFYTGANNTTLGGTERMRINTVGDVGFGISAPVSISTNYTTLDVRGTDGAGIHFGRTSERTSTIYADAGRLNIATNVALPIVFNTNNTERMRITSAGNVVINTSGTSAPNSGQLVNKQRSDTTTPYLNGIVNMASTTSAYLNIYYDNSVHIIAATYYTAGDGGAYKPLTFQTSDVERIRITNGGNILLGTTTDNGEKLYVSGSIRATGSITANSDVRLKKNIERIENALEKVSQISGYTYNTIYDEERHAGLIAQEVDKVLPEIVNTGNDGLMGLEYGNLGALFTEAIKELKIENDSLKARLSALEK